MTIKIEVPANDKTALLAMSVALATIANASPIPSSVELISETTGTTLPEVTEDPVVTEQTHPTPLDPPVLEGDKDSAGYTWDERIHAKTKTRNADQTWKLLRMDKKVHTAESWKAFVTSCKAEQAGTFPRTDNEPATTQEPVKEDPPATTEVPATTQETPPVVPDGDPTFPKLMKLITGSKGKITAQHVSDICNEYELTAIKELLKPDYQILIPTIFEELTNILNA